MEAVLKELEKINNRLEEIANNQNVPVILRTKDIVERYHVTRNKATELCKRYGTKFGSWCIEASKLEEVLKNAEKNFLD